MAGRGKSKTSYYSRRQEAEAQQGQRTYNVQQAAKEKLGTPTDWEIAKPVEPDKKETPPITFRNQPAPTTNSDRPRALKLAYSKEAQKLVVKFRDGTWWEYNEIPSAIWTNLKASDSTGKFLKYSGLDNHDNMGPFDPSEMPPEIRVIFNS